MVPTRAFENHVFIIYADLCGEENGTKYQGGSLTVGPDGEYLARGGAAEALLLAEIDQSTFKFADLDPYLDDRRSELYRL
jgi:predicted amidohydrolase